MSRTVRGGSLASYETTMIREQGSVLAFEAHPSGQPPATFLSTSISESQVVFENPAHAFPQQIGYRLKGDTLLAWNFLTRAASARVPLTIDDRRSTMDDR